MGVATKTIVLEDVLELMFADLPAMNSLKGDSTHNVVFDYGDEKALNAFLKHRDSANTYPLVWLLYPNAEEHTNTNMTVDRLVLLLAVNTNSVMQNKQRMAETFGKMLMPLFFNIRTLFRRANVVNTDSNYKITKYANYSSSDNGDEHAGSLIWDALRIELDSFKLIDTCYRSVTF